MKIKTSELTGAALDWAVARCEGYEFDAMDGELVTGRLIFDGDGLGFDEIYTPSTNWAQGGPIIEREAIGIDTRPSGRSKGHNWVAIKDNPGQDMFEFDGPTPLIAAMRCCVASKLGDEVEIPEELKP